MNRRSLVYWTLSVVLLAWIFVMTAYAYVLDGCRAEGGRWDWRSWHCRPAPAIELRRDLHRG